MNPSTDGTGCGPTIGRYLIINRLGSGGFGDVYLTHDPKHDRQVAVKILRSNECDTNPVDTQKRFLREIKLLAEVRSPHVVAIHGAGVHQDHPYLVMEYVEGNSLGDLLDETGTLSLETAIRIGAAVAEGLLAIHSKGFVHRDIKPENVLIGYGGEIKIIDFGLSKVFYSATGDQSTQLTVAGMALGSPYYISPEASRDAQNAGPKADCYSFGAMMFHVLTGRPVFEEASPMRQLMAHVQQDPPSLASLLPEANKRLVKIIDSSLLKKPEKRPTAMQIADVFRNL